MRTDPLAGHLAKIYAGSGGISFGWGAASDAIRRDPQTHMDALVEANVIEGWYDDEVDEWRYVLLPVKTKASLIGPLTVALASYVTTYGLAEWGKVEEAFKAWENAPS